MRKVLIIIILLVIPVLISCLAGQSASQEGDAKRIIGTWRLVSVVQDGKPGASYGPNPTGLIYYDATGHMAVQIMPSRTSSENAGSKAGPEERKAAMGEYVAYFGTYTVDEVNHIITHHPEGSIEPNLWIGNSGQRPYEFETDDRLVLIPRANRRLTWERIK